jgi:hypothetical protein
LSANIRLRWNLSYCENALAYSTIVKKGRPYRVGALNINPIILVPTNIGLG